MLKAFRYLKPYWLSVLAIIGLIFGQVQAELALPDYMSDIVTYGIQYGGVKESVPKATLRMTLRMPGPLFQRGTVATKRNIQPQRKKTLPF